MDVEEEWQVVDEDDDDEEFVEFNQIYFRNPNHLLHLNYFISPDSPAAQIIPDQKSPDPDPLHPPPPQVFFKKLMEAEFVDTMAISQISIINPVSHQIGDANSQHSNSDSNSDSDPASGKNILKELLKWSVCGICTFGVAAVCIVVFKQHHNTTTTTTSSDHHHSRRRHNNLRMMKKGKGKGKGKGIHVHGGFRTRFGNGGCICDASPSLSL